MAQMPSKKVGAQTLLKLLAALFKKFLLFFHKQTSPCHRCPLPTALLHMSNVAKTAIACVTHRLFLIRHGETVDNVAGI